MQRCPKCSTYYGDELKICRTCGAILEAVAEEPPQAAENDPSAYEDDHADEATPAEQHPWTCSQCGQSVPGGFEVCWNCGTSQDGVPDLDFDKEPEGNEEHEALQPQEAEPEPDATPTGRLCPRCGSAKIIRNARIFNQGESLIGQIQVAVDANPEALIFKDRLHDQLVADVCGNCGHVELRAVHPKGLYEHYLRSSDGAEE